MTSAVALLEVCHFPNPRDYRYVLIRPNLDLVFNGGKFGMWVGNQQFTVRNITVNNANTGTSSLVNVKI